MTYPDALNNIHSLLAFGSRPGLDRIRELLYRMNNPQDKLRFVHVAGTNGKGSTCAMISAVLRKAGYKTGLFISPYITDFRERIQINNIPVSEETLLHTVKKTFPLVEQLRSEGIVITEFEYVNALEFYIHAEANCDVVVLEAGMGGLLDCTNVIAPPLCAVITSIGLDHTTVLGETIEAIATQKCGILKLGSLAVTSAQDVGAMRVIEATAAKRRIPLMKSETIKTDIREISLRGSRFLYREKEIFLPLAGDHQIENAKTALATLEALRTNQLLQISDEAIAAGMQEAVNPARLELLCDEPIVLLDGAHNPNGIEALKAALKRFLPDTPIICVMGMLADKDIDSVITLLDDVFERVFTVPVNNPRSLSAEELAKKFERHTKTVRPFASCEEAYDAAFELAICTNNAILICGSLYLAGEIRPYIHYKSSLPRDASIAFA